VRLVVRVAQVDADDQCTHGKESKMPAVTVRAAGWDAMRSKG